MSKQKKQKPGSSSIMVAQPPMHAHFDIAAPTQIDTQANLVIQPKKGADRHRKHPVPKPRKTKRARGWPKGSGTKKTLKTSSIYNNISLENNNIDSDNDSSVDSNIQNNINNIRLQPQDQSASILSIKAKLNEKEIKFLELYFTGKYTIENAMKLAGYELYNLRYLYRLSRKIVEKYESQTDDHRKVFRSIGAGEVAVAQGLLKLATTAKSEIVRLNAWVNITRCLGLQKEIADGIEGVSIVINAPGQQPLTVGVAAHPGEPALREVTPGLLTITK